MCVCAHSQSLVRKLQVRRHFSRTCKRTHAHTHVVTHKHTLTHALVPTAPPAAMPQAGSQVPQLAAQMPGGFGAPGMPSLNAYGTPYNAAYSTPYGQFTAPNPSLAYAMYSAGGMGYPGAFNSAMPPYPQMGEVGAGWVG